MTVTRADLPSLTGMRWAAALLVFGLHIVVASMLDPASAGSKVASVVFGGGEIGVSFFFVLSGFVLMWSARPGDSPLRFWRRRLARIYPVHVVTALLTVVLGATLGHWARPDVFYGVPEFGVFLANMFLVHSWVPELQQSLNTVSWTLACEVFFYLTFPIWGALARRLSARGAWVFALVSVGLVLLPAVIQGEFPAAHWLQSFPAARLGEFTLGVALARLVALEAWRGPRLEIAVGVMLVSYFLVPVWPREYAFSVATIIGFGVLIPAAAVADLRNDHSFWRSRTMVRLGELSFAFYMIHLLVIRVVRRAEPGLMRLHSTPELFVVAGIFAVSLGLAWVLYEYVETPCRRFLTRPRRKQQELATV
ncbi:acyltransferase [Kutzneria sp. 744]|uniref:acyltransferase family protein n=1 Tax=Kutzneria sp. (strain 744) TaxID=345341 RepID=UPI0003EEB101|nr:acyltransferase [Kutzneria sp. 744]EWM16558.1 acyltransferase MdmB [Kutzneria sp. 744]